MVGNRAAMTLAIRVGMKNAPIAAQMSTATIPIIARITVIISRIRIRARNARIVISIAFSLTGMLTNAIIAVGMNGGTNAPIAVHGLMVMTIAEFARIADGVKTAAIRAAIRAIIAPNVPHRLTGRTIAIFADGMKTAKREFAPIAVVN
jgi:hypothetical protein